VNPFERGALGILNRWMIRTLIDNPALMCVLVLTGGPARTALSPVVARGDELSGAGPRPGAHQRRRVRKALAGVRVCRPCA